MSRARIRRALAPATLIVALAVTGCTSGGFPGGPAAGQTSTPSAAPASTELPYLTAAIERVPERVEELLA